MTCRTCGFGSIRGITSFLVSKQTIEVDGSLSTHYVHGKAEVCSMLQKYTADFK